MCFSWLDKVLIVTCCMTCFLWSCSHVGDSALGFVKDASLEAQEHTSNENTPHEDAMTSDDIEHNEDATHFENEIQTESLPLDENPSEVINESEEPAQENEQICRPRYSPGRGRAYSIHPCQRHYACYRRR